MTQNEPLIIFREIYKCSNCWAIVDPLDTGCPNCPAKFGITPEGIRSGIIIENIDQDVPGHGRFFSLGPTSHIQNMTSIDNGSRERSEAGTERFKLSVDNLKQVQAGIMAKGGIGIALDQIGKEELTKFNRALTSFARDESAGVLLDTFMGGTTALITGLGVAKKQFGSMLFDGRSPTGGRFGMMQIAPSLFGKQSWLMPQSEPCYDGRTYWIHSGSAGYSGTRGNSIRILDGIVMVVLGYGDLIPLSGEGMSPITAFVHSIDGRMMSPIDVSTSFPASSFPFVSLDEPLLLRERTEFRVSYTVQPESEDRRIAPYIYGFGFAMEQSMNMQKHGNPKLARLSEST